ncbi:VWA domain-containing protein [Paraglaciecola sp.]|uniref:VWA domain-containing protein n=1 Tax=Paraglaciecola sp. TaxID=1920173 RepID=UPI003EF29716
MIPLRKILTIIALGGTLLFGATSANSAIINLGFSLDESGSVGTSNFNTTRDALADALAVIPTTGGNQYRLAVTTFSSSHTTVIAPTIVTAANIVGLQAQLVATSFSSGGTDTAGAINYLTSLFNPFITDLTLFNITTDGSPSSQGAAETAALNAHNSFVDGISFEAVGSGINNVSALNNMARIAGLGTAGDVNNGVVLSAGDSIPNAETTGFVIPVATFADYEAAINAKITQIVEDTGGSTDVPAPSSLALFAISLIALGLKRKANR